MGTSYIVYAEVRIKDKWYSINPYIRKINGEIVMKPIYDWGSGFRQAYEEIEEGAYMHGRPDDLSDDVRQKFPEADDAMVEWYKMTYKQFYGQFMVVANYGKVIASRIIPNRDTRYAGYVYKPTIASWELQEIDGIGRWLTKEEYAELPDKEKQEYSWYEWSEWDDWYDHYVSIARKVRMQLNYFVEYGFYGSDLKYNLDDRYPDDSDIRLIIYVS